MNHPNISRYIFFYPPRNENRFSSKFMRKDQEKKLSHLKQKTSRKKQKINKSIITMKTCADDDIYL
jgi:hypothetical protein